MDERKRVLINTIVKEYIKTGNPVGSNLLVDKYQLERSPATVRHEMMELDQEEYIFQPHTSAGRVPTERGYRFYVDNFLEERELAKKEKRFLEAGIKRAIKVRLSIVKELAKTLADLSSETIIVGFGSRDVYYTGLANLFSKPEFSNPEVVYDLSLIIDHLDDVMYDIFDNVEKTINPAPFLRRDRGEGLISILKRCGVKILIGKENPFGEQCSTIISQYRLPRRQVGVLGILGPMRMDYENNVALLKYAKQLVIRLS